MLRIGQHIVLATMVVASAGRCTHAAREQPQHRPPPHPVPAVHPLGNDTSELRVRRTLLQMGTLQSGIITYFRAHASLPQNLGLAFPSVTSPRDSTVIFFDAYQHEIAYSRAGDFYILRSGGGDRAFRTSDDIVWVGFQDRVDPCAIIRGDGDLRAFGSMPVCPAFPGELHIQDP